MLKTRPSMPNTTTFRGRTLAAASGGDGRETPTAAASPAAPARVSTVRRGAMGCLPATEPAEAGFPDPDHTSPTGEP